MRTTRGSQNTLGNIGFAGWTRSCGSSPPICSTRPAIVISPTLAPRAPLAPKLQPTPYTRISICHRISKYNASSTYNSSTTANKNTNFESLLLHGPGSTRWLAHNITTFSSSTHAIKHTQFPTHPTASPLSYYHTLHSPLNITTLPFSGESQPLKRVDTIINLPYTVLSRRTANPIRCATRGNNVAVGYAETTHKSTHAQPHPRYLLIESTRNQDACPLPLPNQPTLVKLAQKTLCNQYLKHFHPTPPTHSNYTQTNPHTLTIP